MLDYFSLPLQMHGNVQAVFCKFLDEGKASIRIKEPCTDILISKVRGRIEVTDMSHGLTASSSLVLVSVPLVIWWIAGTELANTLTLPLIGSILSKSLILSK